VNRDFKKGDHPEADWVEIIAWEKLAEVCGNNLTKGRRVLVEGRLQVRYYEPQDGSGKRKVTEVVAQKVEFLDYKKDGQAEAPAADSASSFGQDVLPEEEIPF
jgi:single-strand DNA-binding protein